MFQLGILSMVKGHLYQSSLEASLHTNLMHIFQLVSEIPPLINSSMRLGIILLLFKVRYAWLRLYHHASV